MSKTKGNGLDPLDLIDGIRWMNWSQTHQQSDATSDGAPYRKNDPAGLSRRHTVLRHGCLALHLLCDGQHRARSAFDLHRIEGYRNFCNKLWNAARFVLMNCEDLDTDGPLKLSLADRWINSRMRDLLETSERAIATYRFDLYSQAIYEFAWHEYCDWYLELTKPLLWDDQADPAELRGTRMTLLSILESLLRAAHPIMPFITEAIWAEVAPRLGNSGATIMLQQFPEEGDYATDEEADTAIAWLKGVIEGIRNIRGEANIKPGQEINVLLQNGSALDRNLEASCATLLKKLAKVADISWLTDDQAPPPNALALVGDLKVMVPLAGLIDVAAERARLNKEVDRKSAERERIAKKLGNPNFVEKAPEDVVAKEQIKLNDIAAALTTLQAQLASLDDL